MSHIAEQSYPLEEMTRVHPEPQTYEGEPSALKPHENHSSRHEHGHRGEGHGPQGSSEEHTHDHAQNPSYKPNRDQTNLTLFEVHNRTIILITFVFLLAPVALQILALIFNEPLIMKNWLTGFDTGSSDAQWYTLNLEYNRVCYDYKDNNGAKKGPCVSYSNIDCYYYQHKYAPFFHDPDFCDRMQSSYVSIVVAVCFGGLAVLLALYGWFITPGPDKVNDQALVLHLSLFLAVGSDLSAIISQICLQHTRNQFTNDEHQETAAAMWQTSFSLVLGGIIIHSIFCFIMIILVNNGANARNRAQAQAARNRRS